MIGRVISGRYEVQAIVGTGGMAVVYRAWDRKNRRMVAIKVLRPEFEQDGEFVRRFSREAEAASKMSHENIVNLLDVGKDNDMRYIVMEYVPGQTLKEVIRQKGRIQPETAVRMAIRILAAVDHAHKNGIVHRDIKPQNILVDESGKVKVADFGIAAPQNRADNAHRRQAEFRLGSVHYFSPEQASGEVADERERPVFHGRGALRNAHRPGALRRGYGRVRRPQARQRGTAFHARDRALHFPGVGRSGHARPGKRRRPAATRPPQSSRAICARRWCTPAAALSPIR